jgi:hypothetical protein
LRTAQGGVLIDGGSHSVPAPSGRRRTEGHQFKQDRIVQARFWSANRNRQMAPILHCSWRSADMVKSTTVSECDQVENKE